MGLFQSKNKMRWRSPCCEEWKNRRWKFFFLLDQGWISLTHFQPWTRLLLLIWRAGRELRDGRGYKQLAPLFYRDGWIFHGTHSCLTAARSAFTTPQGWWREGSACGSASDHDFGLCFVETLGFVWVRCVPVRHPEHGQIPNVILCVEDRMGWQCVQDRSMNTGIDVLDRRTPGCWNKICICAQSSEKALCSARLSSSWEAGDFLWR